MRDIDLSGLLGQLLPHFLRGAWWQEWCSLQVSCMQYLLSDVAVPWGVKAMRRVSWKAHRISLEAILREELGNPLVTVTLSSGSTVRKVYVHREGSGIEEPGLFRDVSGVKSPYLLREGSASGDELQNCTVTLHGADPVKAKAILDDIVSYNCFYKIIL